MFAESFLMDPISIGIELDLGKFFVERNRVERAKLARLSPGVALDLETL